MYKNHIKRFFDIIISLAALPACAFVWLVFAPFIYFEDKGSVFYTADRVGKDGKIYKMYKLRSMKMNAADIRNADGSTFNGKNDPRVTRVGRFLRKTSLDETAQLINVLKGDMSWIGPRPATPMILENTTELQKARFAVRPGITGYTQMMFRNSAQGDKRYEGDKYYVDNISFRLDILIILGTVKRVLKRSNIYNEGSADQKEKEPGLK